jgi:putative ABC transport system ATP-binding protein
METLIGVNESVYIYGNSEAAVTAVDRVSFDVPTNSVIGVVGASGCGKSTLLHMMSGLLTPSSGSITYAGDDLYKMRDKKRTVLRREQFGFIFQAYHLLPGLSALQNIRLPLLLGNKPIDRDYENRLCQTLQISQRLAHYPSELSGGQQQRVAIARALIMKPRVIFADEPTGNLDTAAKNEVFALLLECVHSFGSSLVIVTHDESVSSQIDTLYTMSDGKLIHKGGREN